MKVPIRKRVCIIGAGTAGLCAIKNALDYGMQPVAFEQSASIGGLWVYTEKTKLDDYGLDVCSGVYEGLRTIFPKEAMGFNDFSYPAELKESFVPASQVVEFLQSYANHNKLNSYIKLLHSVVRVRPVNNEWEVIVHDLQQKTLQTYYFDYVLTCIGNYTTPSFPDIEGIKSFQGMQIHSHEYRRKDIFKDKTVLVIGAGPSGIDISMHISKVAKSLFISHHAKRPIVFSTVKNITFKPDVKNFTQNGAVFVDGSKAEFDCIVYCTGYKFTYPFMSSDCGIYIEDNHVQSLYKHCININNPTMAIIGLPFQLSPAQLCDLQLRFVFKYYSGQLSLPNREEMLIDMEREMATQWARGLKKHQAHLMGTAQFDYYTDLSVTAGVKNIKPVVIKILHDIFKSYTSPQFEFETYKKSRFHVIDDENFEKTV